MPKLNHLLLTGALFLSGQCFAQSLFINEISLCNISNDLDPNYDYSGWVELYNSSDAAINLKNLYYSDDAANPKKYRLINVRTIPAQSFALIWLNDEVGDGNGLYLDLDAEGGYFSVADANGNYLDQLTYSQQYTDVTYGRKTDGAADLGYFLKSTCGASNNGAGTSENVVSEPKFSIEGGFYSGSVSVEISCQTEGAAVYYTTDGSYPSETKTLYTGQPVLISRNTPLRARAYKEGYLKGTIATATYMIDQRQPDLPVFFLTTDPANLYDDMIGIYCQGTNGVVAGGKPDKFNYNQDWTRPAHVEMLDTNSFVRINQPIGIAISGNASRHYAQKSLKIKPGKKYNGYNRIDYPLFPNKEGRRFKDVILRNGGQQTFAGALLRDAFLQNMSSSLHLDHQEYAPAVMYLNGEYWGLYNLRERNNKDYVYSNYGWDKTEFDLIDMSWRETVSAGNSVRYNETKDYILGNDISNSDVYSKVREMIDVDSYINYMAIEMHLCNTDWPANNQKFFRNQSYGRWRWILQDLDNCCKTTGMNVLADLYNTESSLFTNKLITYLLVNEEFKQQYITTQCLVAGSVYNLDKASAVLDGMVEKMQNEFPYYAQRWTVTSGEDGLNVGRKNLLAKLATYRNETYNNLKTNFSLGDVVELDITSSETTAQLTFNGQDIPVLPYDGKYFKQKSLKLTAPEYANEKKFACWRVVKGGVSSDIETRQLELTPDADLSVEAVYGKADQVRRCGLYINEISAENATFADNLFKYEDWIEIYNNSSEAIDLGGYYISNNESNLELFQFTASEEETLVPAFGYKIIWCSKKPERGALHANFKLAKEGGVVLLSNKNLQGETQIVDSIAYQQHSSHSTFGRYPDAGASVMQLDQPTFGERNVYSSYNTMAYVQPDVMVASDENIRISLNMTEGGTVTLNDKQYVSSTVIDAQRKVDYSVTLSADRKYHIASVKVNGIDCTSSLDGENTLSLGYIYDDKNIEVGFEANTIGKVVLGLGNGPYQANTTETVDGEMLNNVRLAYLSTHTNKPVLNTEGKPVMNVTLNLDDFTTALGSMGYTESKKDLVMSHITDALGLYPARFYQRTWYFGAAVAAMPETRRLGVLLTDVPEGNYDVRILGSLPEVTAKSDYSDFRYQVNDSPAVTPTSDIFYLNGNEFIEIKNVEVLDGKLMIMAWRENLTKLGYNAPINLIEIVDASGDPSSADEIESEARFEVLSGRSCITVKGVVDESFSICSVDGRVVKTVGSVNGERRIELPSGIYILLGKKAVVY